MYLLFQIGTVLYNFYLSVCYCVTHTWLTWGGGEGSCADSGGGEAVEEGEEGRADPCELNKIVIVKWLWGKYTFIKIKSIIRKKRYIPFVSKILFYP